MDIELLFFRSCPNYTATLQLLKALQRDFGFKLGTREITTIEEAQMTGFLGSPSVRVDGHDILLTGNEQIGLSCRLYQHNGKLTGTPSLQQLHEALT